MQRSETEFCVAAGVATMGCPSLVPAIHFRLLLVGYFECIDSERGIAWRAADALALREFSVSAWIWRRLTFDHSVSMRRPWRRTPRCGVLSDATRAKSYQEYLKKQLGVSIWSSRRRAVTKWRASLA
jgi:hypothetical protein